jgi:N-acetyl-gamma-glutamylphosphate reductase
MGPTVSTLYVWANEARRQAVLVAQRDNLGKGASGRGCAEFTADAGS